MRDEPHGYGVADGLLDGTALDTELLLDCLRLHNIYHQRSAPGVGKMPRPPSAGLLVGCLWAGKMLCFPRASLLMVMML